MVTWIKKLLSEPVIVLKKLPHPFVAIRLEEDVDNSVCDGRFLNSGAKIKCKTSRKPARLFQCTLCKKPYSQAGCLKHHMLIHTGEKPYKCDSCGKAFCRRHLLVQHQRIHTDERPYKCPECDMAFRQSGHLTNHSRQHTSHRLPIGVGYERTQDSKLFACTVCKKSFTTNRWLKSHTRIFHTGETPYKCEHCCEEFTSYNKYHYHVNVRHMERKLVCPDCGKRFTVSWNLNAHRLLHSNNKHYVCSECDVRFLYAKDSKIHLLRHYAVSQTCHVCGQILSNPIKFTEHIKGHIFRKSYTCGRCGKEFTARAGVVHHFDWCHTNKYRKVKV